MKQIKTDLFNISKRLKKINKDLNIVFNKTKRQFEIFNTRQKVVAYTATNLNAVILQKAHKTSPKFARKIFCQIAEHNNKLQRQTQNNIMEQNLDLFKNYINYANKKNADINFENFNTTKWV